MQMRTIALHGGPMHGKAVAVPVGQDHIHIRGLDERVPDIFDPNPELPAQVPTREGTYSQVSGRPNDFEWDGWVADEHR